jgi:hypothetical protein
METKCAIQEGRRIPGEITCRFVDVHVRIEEELFSPNCLSGADVCRRRTSRERLDTLLWLEMSLERFEVQRQGIV